MSGRVSSLAVLACRMKSRVLDSSSPLSLRRRNPSRVAATASRPLALPGLILQQLGKLGCGLLYVGRKVRKLMHLANFDHFVVRTRAALGPFDRFFLRLHLNHPVAAEYFLGFGERPIGHRGLPSRERDARAHRGRLESIERK